MRTRCANGVAQSSCERLACTEFTTEKCCTSFEDCTWDISQTPVVCSLKYCQKTYATASVSAACTDDTQCEFNTTSQTCVAKNCNDLEECDCRADPVCYWDTTTSPIENCRNAEYGECPIMDIVFLVDASTQMTRQFGRHRKRIHRRHVASPLLGRHPPTVRRTWRNRRSNPQWYPHRGYSICRAKAVRTICRVVTCSDHTYLGWK